MLSVGVILLVVGLCFYLGILYTNQVILTIGYALMILLVISLLELIYRLFTIFYDSLSYMTYPALLFAKVEVRKVIICKGKMTHCLLFVCLLDAKVIVF